MIYEEPGINVAGYYLFHNGNIEIDEIGDLMSEGYIEEQTQLEEDGESVDWEVDNPFLD